MSGLLTVREFFPTVQGEGSASGTAAVFVRFTGCNLWSGLVGQRSSGRGICAAWCDTDFHGGDRYEADKLADAIVSMMRGWNRPVAVLTGGEPLLQLRKKQGEVFCSRLLDAGVELHLETNGTVQADVIPDLHHVTVSPKMLSTPSTDKNRLAHIVVRSGTDLKVVHPQWSLVDLATMEAWEFQNRYLQPLDAPKFGRWKGSHLEDTTLTARMLGWRVSIQTHKLVGWE